MKPRLIHRISLAAKMSAIMLLVVVAVFSVIKWNEARSLKDFFIGYHSNSLEKDSHKGLLRFNEHLKEKRNSVKFLVTQKRFLDYLESFKMNIGTGKEKINVKYYDSLPAWFPHKSLTRAFFQSSFALLIDPYGRVREVYQGIEKSMPQSLLNTDELLPRIIKTESLLTYVDGVPFQLIIQHFSDPNYQLPVTLLFAFPIDSDFIRASQGGTHHNHVVALLDDDNRVIASSSPNLVPNGATIESLGKEFIAVGKSFIGYGEIEIDIKFVSLVPKKVINLFIKKILSNQFKHGIIYGIAFILSSTLVVLFMAGKIKKLTNRIVEFLRNTLGIEYSVNSGGDELYTLQTSFHQMEDRIITSQNRLSASKQNWEDTFNTITDMITIHDRDFNIIHANKAAEKILSIPSLEITKVIKCYNLGKDCPPQWGSNCERLKSGKSDSYELFEPHLNKFFEIRSIPRFDNNEIIGVIHIVRDITENKKIEKELIRTQKLSSLGRMLAGIGHEIKNPLAGIGMLLKSIQNSFGEEDDRRKDTLKISNEIRNLEKLVDNIVRFSKPKSLIFKKENLRVPIENSLVFVKKALRDKKIRIKKDYHHNGTNILFDPESLQQVFINLFLNAIESMDNRGILNIDVYEINNGQSMKPGTSNINSRQLKSTNIDPGMRVIIKDSGHGINKDNLEKIFDPYFSTNSRKTGLGLYITHQIISEHKGKIKILSKESEGTTCVVTLPSNSDIKQNNL